MPSGTLAISKTRTTPVTFEVMFVPNLAGTPLAMGLLTIESVEELRSILDAVGVDGVEQDKAVRGAIRDSVALLRDVVLTEAFIEKHRL
jgi:hypothetical protein